MIVFQIGRANYQTMQIPLHMHKTYEITAYYQGSGIVCTADREIPVGAGKITIMPPGVLHGAVSSGDLESLHISGDFRGVFQLEKPILIKDNSEREGMQLLWLLYRNRYKNNEYISALSNALAHFLMQNLTVEDAISMSVRTIAGDISERFLDSSLSLSELLNRSGYAEDYIRAHFKRIIGKTPTAFLHELRIKHACYLIETYHHILPLSEIAAQCGYTDYVLFSKRFKTVVGVSPKEFKDAL